MIRTKVISYEFKAHGTLHKLLVRVTGERTGSGACSVPLSPLDVLAGHVPEVPPGRVRRLVSARTNRAGTTLVALVHDAPSAGTPRVAVGRGGRPGRAKAVFPKPARV